MPLPVPKPSDLKNELLMVLSLLDPKVPANKPPAQCMLSDTH